MSVVAPLEPCPIGDYGVRHPGGLFGPTQAAGGMGEVAAVSPTRNRSHARTLRPLLATSY